MKQSYTYKYVAMLLFMAAVAISCGSSDLDYRGGMYHGETEDGLPSGYGTWTAPDGSTYTGFWAAGRRQGYGISTARGLTYRGGFANDKYDGYGELTMKDSVLYSGEWRGGRRQGHGTVTDSRGRRIEGVWVADTLAYGMRTDSGGVYSGQLSLSRGADGHGEYQGYDGVYYNGRWSDDRRSGFGFSLSPTQHIKAGEWRNDRYKGERMVYTSERIYGIDISKYQHIIGRRRYGIDWKNLRITHLGSISRKRVSGSTDFPVSFVYIKSTEGTTVRNQFYANDYRQARRRGLKVGSYHFFSHRTDAAAQARYFLRHSRFSRGDFPPVLDVEPTDRQIKSMGGAQAMFRRIRTWLDMVERATKCRPVLYVSQSFVNKYLSAAPDIKNKYEVWIARYGEYKPDVRLVYWQLSPDGRVRGIRGEVDINVFNGYRTVYDEFCASRCIK